MKVYKKTTTNALGHQGFWGLSNHITTVIATALITFVHNFRNTKDCN